MAQLGRNAHGETLDPGRVPDCYLGLLLPPGPAGEPEAGTVLVVAPAGLLHPRVPQPDGSLVYGLLTGHPEREAGELVFVADLTGELRAGDPGLALKAQQVVLYLAGAEQIGVRLTSTLMMNPTKSTSIVQGVGLDLPPQAWSRCDSCRSRERCARRIEVVAAPGDIHAP